MKRLPKKQFIILAAVLAIVVVFFSLLSGGSAVTSGSTYLRTPDGYGAWFQYMEQQGHKIDRWRKTSDQLFAQENTKETLLRVQSTMVRRNARLDRGLEQWVERGNTFVVLGVQENVASAPFESELSHPTGNVTIATRRRHPNAKTSLLEDRFGTVVWSKVLGKGRVVMATTPYLAANAYQDRPGNFKFLEQVIKPQGQIWVDEYLHGYREPSDRRKKEKQNSVFGYFAQTPWAPIAVQGLVFLVLMIWVGNRRFGPAAVVAVPEQANSEVYIQALAGALQKSDNSAYILDVVGRAELLLLQSRLGLNNRLLDPPALVSAWVERTGRPAQQIEQVLRLRDRALTSPQSVSRQALSTWLAEVRSLQQALD